LTELQHLYGITLNGGKARDCLPQRRHVAVLVHRCIRALVGKGYREILDRNLMRGTPRMAPPSIGETISRDREQPRDEWPLRVVSGAHGMHGEQNILYQIFDIFCFKKSPLGPNNLAQPRGDFFEKPDVS